MLEMRLHNEPFIKIKSGSKTVEIRLNDEKRSQLKVGDKVKFTSRTTNEQIITEVTELLYFNNFYELYNHFPNKVELGYAKNEIADAKDMEQYYSAAEQQKYGVVAIKIKLIK